MKHSMESDRIGQCSDGSSIRETLAYLRLAIHLTLSTSRHRRDISRRRLCQIYPAIILRQLCRHIFSQHAVQGAATACVRRAEDHWIDDVGAQSIADRFREPRIVKYSCVKMYRAQDIQVCLAQDWRRCSCQSTAHLGWRGKSLIAHRVLWSIYKHPHHSKIYTTVYDHGSSKVEEVV